MRRAVTALLFIALFLFAGGCSSAPQLRIATDAAFPPFHLTDQSGRVTGYDIELARAAARRAGFEPVVVVVPVYADLFTGLDDGAHDMIAATTGITAPQQERFLFSEPYFRTCQAAIVRAGKGEPTTVAALRGRRIAASKGGTSEAAARAVGAAELVFVSKERGGVDALLAHEVDAYMADEFDAVALSRARKEIKVLSEPAALENYGFVMRKDDADLKRRIDAALRELESDGTIASLRARFNLNRPPDWPIKLPRE